MANLILFWLMMFMEYVSQHSNIDIYKLLNHHYCLHLLINSTLQNLVDDLLTHPVEEGNNGERLVDSGMTWVCVDDACNVYTVGGYLTRDKGTSHI